MVTKGRKENTVDHDATPTGHFTRRDSVLCTTNMPTESYDSKGKIATLPVILGGSMSVGSVVVPKKIHFVSNRREGCSSNCVDEKSTCNRADNRKSRKEERPVAQVLAKQVRVARDLFMDMVKHWV